MVLCTKDSTQDIATASCTQDVATASCTQDIATASCTQDIAAALCRYVCAHLPPPHSHTHLTTHIKPHTHTPHTHPSYSHTHTCMTFTQTSTHLFSIGLYTSIYLHWPFQRQCYPHGESSVHFLPVFWSSHPVSAHSHFKHHHIN